MASLDFLDSLNNSKYLFAMMMLLMNVGGKYIEMDISKHHKSFLASSIIFRRLLIFTIALYLRVFNLNFDDYWFDEQVTFFISNPNVNIDETLKRIGEYNNSSDYTFAIILKYFFRIFSYSPEIGRLVPVLFSVLSIPAIASISEC